jgi:hypothetical protein
MKLGSEQGELLEKTMAKLNAWDFSLTVQKLQEPAYAGWTENRALIAERDYKRYLAVTKVFDGYQPVPNGDIDRFWHEHILDTRRYAADMEDLLGYFLHHYPFFGMRGEDDNRNWVAAVGKSNDIWQASFGEALYSVASVGSGESVKSSVDLSFGNQEGEDAMPVQITITITVGDNGGVRVATSNPAAAPMKCPQACPNPGTGAILGAEPMKCPQACPNPGTDATLGAEPMKCPQSCPNPVTER